MSDFHYTMNINFGIRLNLNTNAQKHLINHNTSVSNATSSAIDKQENTVKNQTHQNHIMLII
jgi:hypothetical protein